MAYLAQQGLTTSEAHARLDQYGPNTVVTRRKLRPLVVLAKKFANPLSIILILAALLSYFLGEGPDALIIIVMVMVGAGLDFFNSYHSEQAIAELEARVESTVAVRRDGRVLQLPTGQIVPGDVVELAAGDLVPGDGAIITTKDLQVNESSLTGESFPVAKTASLHPTDEALTDSNPRILLMGTGVVSGAATVLIRQTGSRTRYGQLAKHLEAAQPESDFERGIRSFSYFIMRLTFVMVIFVFFVNALFGRGVLESFLFAVAIAIGLTPELLPVILSVSLSRGSVEMAKKNVIVRRLSTIQNFGSMTVLCTDKTGTLTEDRIVLIRWVDDGGAESSQVLRLSAIASHFHSGPADPFDEAIKRQAKVSLSGVTKVDEVPFDFRRRRSSVIVREKNQLTLVSHGAPEEIFSVASHVWHNGRAVPLTGAARSQAKARFDALSQDGYRVLAVAAKTVKAKTHFEQSDEAGLTLYGFVAFLDPPKSGVGQALKELERLGIGVKIITGDHELLTEKVCRQVGLAVTGLLDGPAIAKLSDRELTAKLATTNVFTRVEPDQKERIVLLLKKSGAVVGFLGDGINDAPSLKAADVGISVNNAVTIAKDSADIILLKKSLEVLRDGVAEGRRTFQNTLKYILMGLSSNFGNVFSMAGGSLFLPFLPMQPTQILLNNFLYDMSQLSLSTDRVDAAAITKPLKWDFRLIRRYMIVFGIVSSAFDFVTFFVAIHFFHLGETRFQTIWFLTSFVSQTLVIFFIRTKKIPFLQSRPSLALVVNVLLLVGLGVILPFTIIGRYFSFGHVSGAVAGAAVLIVGLYLISIELTKHLFYRFNPNL